MCDKLGEEVLFRRKSIRPELGALKKNGATVLSRALEVKRGDFPPEGARFILGLGINEADKKRMLKLLGRQQNGRITAEELIDLESYVQADNLLSILKAHAVLALKKAGQKL
jgi:hypothetical protein